MALLTLNDDDACTEWNSNQLGLGSLFRLTSWAKIIQQEYFWEPVFEVAKIDGKMVGGVASMRKKARWVSMPFIPGGGFWGKQSEIINIGMEVKNYAIRPAAVDNTLVTLVKKIPKNETELWTSYPPRTRTKVRQVLQHAFQMKFVDLSVFYPLYQKAMHEFGTPAHNRAWFEKIIAEFGDKVTMPAILIGNTPVFCSFEIAHNNCVYYLYGAGDKSHYDKNPSMALFHNRLKELSGTTFTTFDFGRSERDSGTYRFKRQWNAEPFALNYVRLLEGKNLEPLPKPGNTLQFASEIWKKLPFFVIKSLNKIIRSKLDW
jgi:hypothetical protein